MNRLRLGLEVPRRKANCVRLRAKPSIIFPNDFKLAYYREFGCATNL
jgi:hypothetical protein